MDIPTSGNNGLTKQLVVPIIKSSPAEPVDSPPLSEPGLPRTPSPSTSPSLSYTSSTSNKGSCSSNNLKIPLKYQRQSSKSSEKHYKKKFRERNWEEYEMENFGHDDSTQDHQEHNDHEQEPEDNNSSSSSSHQHNSSHHKIKSAKFRPKGKDWNWRDKHKNNFDSSAEPSHASTST